MTAPSRGDARVTPNEATTTRPERSSTRVARKAPLGWLPWLLLGLLALLTALTFLIINAVDDDGAEGPAGDSLGQLSGSDGSGVNGEDAAGTTEGGAPQGGSPDLADLAPASLVGGAGVRPEAASAAPTTVGKREAGTVGTVLFAEGSAALDQNANQVIAQAVQTLRDAGLTRVTVAGYTDVIAGEQVNDLLSQQRADAVSAALTRALPELQVTTEARGQDSPVAPNTDEAGRQQNRRASIVATA